MGGVGGPELLVIFLVVLLVFGPKKIPEVARGVGKGLREIRKLTTEFQREINLSDPDEEKVRIGPERVQGSAGGETGAPDPDSGSPPPDTVARDVEGKDPPPPDGPR